MDITKVLKYYKVGFGRNLGDNRPLFLLSPHLDVLLPRAHGCYGDEEDGPCAADGETLLVQVYIYIIVLYILIHNTILLTTCWSRYRYIISIL